MAGPLYYYSLTNDHRLSVLKQLLYYAHGFSGSWIGKGTARMAFLCSMMSGASAGKTHRLGGNLTAGEWNYMTGSWWRRSAGTSAGAVNYNTYTWPLHVVSEAASQHGGCVPSVSAPRERGESCITFYDLASKVTYSVAVIIIKSLFRFKGKDQSPSPNLSVGGMLKSQCKKSMDFRGFVGKYNLPYGASPEVIFSSLSFPI